MFRSERPHYKREDVTPALACLAPVKRDGKRRLEKVTVLEVYGGVAITETTGKRLPVRAPFAVGLLRRPGTPEPLVVAF